MASRSLWLDKVTYNGFDWQPSTLAAATRILAAVFGSSTQIGNREPLWDSPENCKRNVLRCEVHSNRETVPKTVILKRVADSQAHYDEKELQPGTIAWRHSAEWAACRLLERLGSKPALSPRCYGGDRTEALLVLEDLGTGPTVASLLHGHNVEQAERALLSYAETLGRLHATTCGREVEYNGIWESLGMPALTTAREDDLAHIFEHLVSVRASLTTLGYAFSPAAEEELSSALQSLRDPGAFLALGQGDPNPVNDLLQGERVRLYDFEYSGFRHALMDGVFNRHLYPWTRYRLPESMLAQMEVRYRGELARACPEAQDEPHFRLEQLRTRLVWLLVTLRFLLEQTLTPSLCQRTLILLERFTDDTEMHGCLPAMSAATKELGALLEARWQLTAPLLPLYPAFQLLRSPEDADLG